MHFHILAVALGVRGIAFRVGNMLGRLLERMDSIEEANGTTLLDNTIFTLGAGLFLMMSLRQLFVVSRYVVF